MPDPSLACSTRLRVNLADPIPASHKVSLEFREWRPYVSESEVPQSAMSVARLTVLAVEVCSEHGSRARAVRMEIPPAAGLAGTDLLGSPVVHCPGAVFLS
jgi:hypothetical protein